MFRNLSSLVRPLGGPELAGVCSALFGLLFVPPLVVLELIRGVVGRDVPRSAAGLAASCFSISPKTLSSVSLLTAPAFGAGAGFEVGLAAVEDGASAGGGAGGGAGVSSEPNWSRSARRSSPLRALLAIAEQVMV